MNSALSLFQKLEKVLLLETSLGCTDEAVIGGLDSFVAHWRDEAQQGTFEPAVDQFISETGALLETYSVESVSRRREMIEDVLGKWVHLEPQVSSEEAEASSPEITQPAKAAPPSSRTSLSSPVQELHGVSDNYARRLERLGVSTIQDLLYLFPVSYTHLTLPTILLV